jgi:hypothetical protein
VGGLKLETYWMQIGSRKNDRFLLSFSSVVWYKKAAANGVGHFSVQ